MLGVSLPRDFEALVENLMAVYIPKYLYPPEGHFLQLIN